MAKPFSFISKYKIPLFIILLTVLSTALRIYKLPQTYIFGFDEEYQATYAWTLVQDFHPIWIGVSASFLDYYMGPYFTYFTGLLLFLSHGDVMITAYFAVFIGILTTLAIFLVGWKLFNLTTGIMASLLYANLPLFVFYDQKYWNPMFTSLIVLGILVVLNLVKKSKYWLVGFTALVGIVLQTDLTPAPFLLIGLFYFIKGKYWKDIKLMLICILVFLVFYWPLIVFDYNHKWSNITAPFRLAAQLQTTQAVSFNPLHKVQVLLDSLGRVWFLKPGNSNADEIHISCTSLSTPTRLAFIDKYAERTYPSLILSLLSFGLIIIAVVISFKKKNNVLKILIYLLSFKIIFFLVYPGGSFEYYILDFLTLFLFLPGFLISQLKLTQKLIPLALIFLAVLSGIFTVAKISDKFGLGPKKELISEIMDKVGDKKFEIKGEGICHNFEGWRYLFKFYGKTPTKSYTDANFAWLYPKEVSSDTPEVEVILVESRLLYQENFNGLRIDKGGYSGYIKDIYNK